MFSNKEIAGFSEKQTPFWYYNLDLLKETLEKLNQAASKNNYKVHYALKANSNEEILRLISASGLGADCVSGREIERAVTTGFQPDHIAFAGVGKSDEEIRIGLQHNIFSFNCESIQELEVINEWAGKSGKQARVALRINPNVNAKTHAYITTGLDENKFGINTWELEAVLDKLKTLPHLVLKGIHFHIGSQVSELSVFKGLCVRINEIQRWFIDHQIIPEHVNVGGGLGVEYDDPDSALIPDFGSFFRVFQDHLELRPGQELHFELGRSIVAQCGSLITKVLYIKTGQNISFAIVDAGMTELIRPALYQSTHRIEKIGQGSGMVKYDVVGPICESSDCFAKSILLPELKRGDLLVIRTAGAYGEVMSSGYNLRDKAKAYYNC